MNHDWPVARLIDIAPLEPAKWHPDPNENIWLLTLDQIESDSGSILERRIVNSSEIGNSTHAFDESHVLYSKLRPNLNKVVVPDTRGVSTSELLPLKPDPKRLDRQYLAHFLRSPGFLSWVVSRTDGAKMPRVKMEAFRQYELSLPPLIEQKNIVAILDKADAIRKKRRESLELADEFLRSVFLDMFGDPVTNPKGWPKEELGSLTTKIGSGATPLGGDSVYHTSGITFIRSMNVYDRSFLMDNLAHLDDTQATKLSNVEVQSGDLLLNITGASVARSCLVPDEILPARVNQHVCIIRSSDQLIPEFLEAQIVCESVKKILLGIGESMGATRQAITKAQLEKFKVVVPPKSMQIRYANIVKKIQRQKSNMQIFLDESDILTQSLQQQAFS